MAIRIRMKDIARDLGVSVITVSKALRNREDISRATRERVLQRAKELNYQPNWAARSLASHRTQIVGLVVPDLLHPFFAEVAMVVSRVLRSKGYHLLIASTEEDPVLEDQEIDSFIGRQVDGLIVASVKPAAAGETFRRLESLGVPLLLIDRFIANVKAHYVGVDDQQVGSLAGEHLLSCGCKRIAHIGGPRKLSTAGERLRGFVGALQSQGQKVPEEYVVRLRSVDTEGEQSGYEAMEQLAKLRPPPDGVFCYNDIAAMGALEAASEIGLRVPQDIAIIGSGNLRYGKHLRTSLSTIDQNTKEIGERAARGLLGLLRASERPKRFRKLLVQPRLIPRDSTRVRRARGWKGSQDNGSP